MNSSDIETIVLQSALSTLSLDEAPFDKSLIRNLGADSLAMVEIFLSIEEKIGDDYPEMSHAELTGQYKISYEEITLQDICIYVVNNINGNDK